MRWDDILNVYFALRKPNPGVKDFRTVYVCVCDLSSKVANVMDQQFSEDFSTHSFENLKSMNYYFEIHSDWARGNLMVSIILDQQIPIEVVEKIQILCKEFSEQIQSNKEIFKAFYINDINHFNEEDQKNIIKNESLISAWVMNFYWALIEATREKIEEEKIAFLLKNKRICLFSKEFVRNTILIIDNEPDILNLTEKFLKLEDLTVKFLKLEDFETITCSNVNEALKLIEGRYNDIGIIFLNPMTPGLNIYEFYQFIKSDESYKHISVISTEKVDEEGGDLPYSLSFWTTASAGAPAPVSAGPSVDPQLKGEIQSFLDWIKDSEGLAGYINYYLQQNNHQVISELSKIYNELKQITINGIQKLKIPKAPQILENEYKINEYITLKLEDKNTQIYVNGKKFLQCMRLFLQIPPHESHLYEELESIDEAAEVYKQSLSENEIVDSRFQNTTITPEQEFWGHCSNLQAWVEHDYDTRLLMSNASFPLLKKLAEAGDPVAKKVFKGEIAQRLESGYPSVVHYLIAQRYIRFFTPFEFKTIIETTNLIKNVSSQPKMLSNFLQVCAKGFPTILGDIVLKILELPEGKENLITVSSRESWELSFRVPLDSNPKFLDIIKDELIDKLKKVRKDKKGDILDYIQVIYDNVDGNEVERAELKKINEEAKKRRRNEEFLFFSSLSIVKKRKREAERAEKKIIKKKKKRLKVIRKKEEKAEKKLQKIRSYLIRDFQDEEIKKEFKKQFGRDQTIEDINHWVDGQMQYAMHEIIDKYQLGSDSDREIKEKKESEILLEIAINDFEYKILLKRKKAGESVEDLIKQNRSYAEILKKDKDNIEEAKKWY